MAQDVIYSGEGSVCTWEKGEVDCFGVKGPIDVNKVRITFQVRLGYAIVTNDTKIPKLKIMIISISYCTFSTGLQRTFCLLWTSNIDNKCNLIMCSEGRKVLNICGSPKDYYRIPHGLYFSFLESEGAQNEPPKVYGLSMYIILRWRQSQEKHFISPFTT